MFELADSVYRSALAAIAAEGLTKSERVISTPQGVHLGLTPSGSSSDLAAAAARAGTAQLLNFCANNYLGLADHPVLISAAQEALSRWGFGTASVRFICGTQEVHKELESRLAGFLGTEDSILFSSCFDANGGVFETLLDESDAIISDALNHASIIDGIRLSKAQRFRYANRDLAELRRCLERASTARLRLIVTDGVFSMDGHLAPLDAICDLADEFGAMVMVDDSHAVGFTGATGAGTPELFGVQARVDVLTGTFGKALGGASGGYVAGRGPIVDLLRQRARPYLFSNALAPSIAAATLAALDLIATEGSGLRQRLTANTAHFRRAMTAAGFTIVPGEHPITPVMFGDANLASRMAEALLAEGVYAIAFSYPVVPMGAARIRVQLSAGHTGQDVDAAVAAFVAARARVG